MTPPRGTRSAGGDSTRAVHGAERGHQSHDALTTPIHQTSTYRFENSAQVRDYQEGRQVRDEYGRYGNPTWRAVERTLATLEQAEDAVLFGSGMCAITTTLLALLRRGGHLIMTNDGYRRTRQFCDRYLSKLGIDVTVIEAADLGQLEAALRSDTDVVFTELPTNPYLRVIDLPAAARLAHAQGALVIVDATLATPMNYRPLLDGADLVLHSATKYLGGHNDLLAGVVAGSRANVGALRDAVGILGGVVGPHDAYLLLRGLKTLGLRMARHNDNGLRVARMLDAHPRVSRVFYPGLTTHWDYETATRLMAGFGGVVTFEIDGDLDTAARFVDACRIPYIAPSLGGVESLIEMPVLMSYWDLPSAERRQYGISDALVRLSCGVEDYRDLADDLEQALGAI